MRPALEGTTIEKLWLRDRGDVPEFAGVAIEEVVALGKHLLIGSDRVMCFTVTSACTASGSRTDTASAGRDRPRRRSRASTRRREASPAFACRSQRCCGASI
jgi:hypothetical protein